MQPEDILGQQEDNKLKSTKDKSSEDKTQQQVNQQIRFTPITPTTQISTMLTTITQVAYTKVDDDLDNPENHPNKPTTSSKCISGLLCQFLQCTGHPGGGGPPDGDPDGWDTLEHDGVEEAHQEEDPLEAQDQEQI